MLEKGEATAAQLTQTYLDRIDAIDRSGPRLQSVLALNPDAMAQAEASDTRRRGGRNARPARRPAHFDEG